MVQEEQVVIIEMLRSVFFNNCSRLNPIFQLQQFLFFIYSCSYGYFFKFSYSFRKPRSIFQLFYHCGYSYS